MPVPKSVVPSILEPDAAGVEARIRTLPDRCSLVEIRADLLSPDDLGRVVTGCGKDVIVTARREQDGGRFTGSESERQSLLLSGLHAGAAFVDLEIDSPAAGEHSIPQERLVLSWHGDDCREEELQQVLSRMTSQGAARYKLVPRATRTEDLVHVYRFLNRLPVGSPAVACFASGPRGTPSRILALSWGSCWTLGFPPGGQGTAPGQLPVLDLLDIYDVTSIGKGTRLFGLLGNDLAGSPSPAMHNAALQALDLDSRYLAMETDRFEDLAILAEPHGPFSVAGFGVTMPFKEHAAGIAVGKDRFAREAGAVNTLVPAQAGWQGHNTDATAIRQLISATLAPRVRQVLIYGAGGTARTAAAVFRAAGDKVTLLGRDHSRVQQVAGELGVEAASSWPAAGEADILVNATPEGGRGEPWSGDRPLPGELVLDAPYGAVATDLVRKARDQGLDAGSGRRSVPAVDRARTPG